MMNRLTSEVLDLVQKEYQWAAAEHGGAANSPHEGFALIKEEEEEAADQMSAVSKRITSLWFAVKADDLFLQGRYLNEIKDTAILGACELIQVAAMAEKAIQGLKNEEEKQAKDTPHIE